MTNDAAAADRSSDADRATEIIAGNLAIEFVKHGDRYGHRISLLADNGERVPILESIEGTAEEAWPVSPPLQHLHVETQGGRRVALLVGMAGKSHWSASVATNETGDGVVFDVACRLQLPAERLGSAYRRLNQEAPVELTIDATKEATFEQLVEPGKVGLCSHKVSPPVTTVCWRYTVRRSV